MNIERGKRIRGIRKNLDVNQKKFGEMLGGIKTSTVSGYETGDVSPNLDALTKVAELGSVSLDWLITGSELIGGPIAGQVATNNQGTKESSKPYPKVTERNVHLRQIIEWMDAEFGQKDEQALFFYEDLKDRYPTFAEFMEKKRPGGSSLATSTQNEKLNSA